MRGYFKNSLFSNKNFSFFFFGQSVSTIGDGFQQIALIYLIFELGGSGSEMALALFFLVFPRILLLLVGGVAVDRLSAKQVIWVSDFARFAIMAALILFLVSDSLSFPLLYLLLSLSGVASGFFYPAFNTIVPSVVETKDLEKANAWVQSISQTAIFIGPPLAGLVVGLYGVEAGFLINAVSYLIGAITGIMVSVNKELSTKVKDSRLLADFAEGFQQVWKTKWLRTVLLVDLVGGLVVVGPMQITLLLYARESFHLAPSQMGFVLAAFGAGSVIGMMFIAKLQPKHKTLRSFYWLELLQGLIMFLLALPSVWIVMLSLAAIGILNGISSVIIISKIQANVPKARLGRTMSIVSLAAFGAVPISQLATGWLSDLVPYAFVFVLASTLLFFSGLMGLIVYSKQRVEEAVV
ncbi:Predicted arabinose efflux permease, MFS family [Planococcus glaciei]|uniref:MFS transporter n=1 Tax=Planococcus glaciei TaxID=459472 RepID=UPI000889BAA8|nr:MFS transporter [Planococcus glaciei]SDG76518.1 Predicted arabinose efflux permease, MFS family [Planococcus glaciei]